MFKCSSDPIWANAFGMFHNKQGNILLIGISYFHKQTPNISVLTSHVGSLSLRKNVQNDCKSSNWLHANVETKSVIAK